MIYLNNGYIITGGIACGKSTVCNMLNEYGFEIIDADKVAHEALSEHKDMIAKKFDCIKNGEIDRQALGKIVFADYSKKHELEQIVHPLMFDKIADKAKLLEKNNKPYFIDMALYFETGQKLKTNGIVVVYLTQQEQLSRLCKRNNFSKEEALLRINAQMNIDEKKAKADYVINNNSDILRLKYETQIFLEKIHAI